MVPDTESCRGLFSQARQEAAHALVLQGAIAWLAPKHLGDAPFLPALEAYWKMLDDALARQDVLETFPAEQVAKIVVSVIIPTYNEERALPHMLREFLCQSGDYEAIVVDGGSTDRAREVLPAYGFVSDSSSQTPHVSGLQEPRPSDECGSEADHERMAALTPRRYGVALWRNLSAERNGAELDYPGRRVHAPILR